MADVFISYKREERPAVERLAQALRALNLDVWFDASLNAGEAFSDEIDREAHAAKTILVCWSPTARESKWVKSEALIGFEQGKLAACYVAGPDGFYPPTPFNSIHADDMRAWLAAPSATHAGWKSLLRRVGKLSGREDIESYGALDVQAPASALRAWLAQHGASPLFMAVDALLRARDAEDAERARLEQEARERRAREEAERARLEAERKAREDAELRARQEAERRAREEEAHRAAERARQAEAEARKRKERAQRMRGVWIGGAVALIALLLWAPWNSPPPPAGEGQGRGRSTATDTDTATAAATLTDGQTFRDCAGCPEMVVIPAGSFLMGSPEGEVDRDSDEGPQRRVTIGQPFAVGRFEVTFDEYDACVADGACAQRPDDRGWGRGRRPVINVSWNDAQAYARWLSRKTGQRYRLLTEAEWEYAARAGTTTRWSFGDDEGQLGAHAWWFWDNSNRRTQPVGGKAANRFGLHDVHGNVWEWVEDCYANTYSGLATNGSANTTQGCSSRVGRGGSWYNYSQVLRSAARLRITPTLRSNYIGFRLARTL